MRDSIKHIVAAVALGSFVGCATFQPQLSDGPCRDSATGRFISCPSSGGSPTTEGALAALGIAAGLGLIAGIVYLATRPSTPENTAPAAEATAAPAAEATATASCALPAEAVRVCLSSRGYRFAIPWPGADCAPGSAHYAYVRLTCDALTHPAYHACLDASGEWTAVRSWETCASRGRVDAPGDFVPPGRQPSQGVAPDAVPEIPLSR